ncbi:MAG: tetratricopeptide repeat protein [Thermodesulfobacteriota bacterium]
MSMLSRKKTGIRFLLVFLLLGFLVATGCSKEAEKTSSPSSGSKASVSSEATGKKVWINRWAFARPMQVKRAGVAAVVVGKRIYAIGGGEFSRKGLEIFKTVEYADVLPGGDLGPWKFSGPLTMPRVYPVAVIHGDYIYVMGGESLDEIYTGAEEQKAPKLLKTVERARINPDGTLGKWTLEKVKMHFPRRGGEVFAVDGWLYAGGGFGGDFLNDVERAPINPDGSLGEWEDESFFNNDRYISGFAAKGRRLYVMGGHINSPARAMDSVETAEVRADGTLTEWTETSPLYTRRFLNTALVSGDTIYTFAGHNTINLTSVEKAAILKDGKLGKWEPDTPLNMPRRAASAVEVGGRLYVIGGMVKPMGVSDSVNVVETAEIVAGRRLGNYVDSGSKAFAEYKALEETVPADAMNHISHGKAYFKKKAYKSVLFDAEEALKEHPAMAEAYNLMADTYFAMGKKKEAKKTLEKSLDINKDNFYALAGLAYMAYEKGEFGESVKLYKRALVIEPDSLTAHFNLGDAYLNSGAYELAAKEFKWVLAKKPDLKDAQRLLKMSLKHVGGEGRKLK